MAHRERAKSRLDRRIPGENVRRSSVVESAIVYRTRPIPTFEIRDPYGEALMGRSEPRVTSAKTVEPEPNSPLLIRLVRDPYSLEPVSHSRTRVREIAAPVSRVADAFPSAMAEWRKVRFDGFTGNPARNLSFGPAVRTSPTAIAFTSPSGERLCR